MNNNTLTMEWQQEECWDERGDEEYPVEVTTMEHQEGLTAESAATNQQLTTTLSSDENEYVDREQETTVEDSRYDINSDEQRGCEWSGEDNFTGM